MRERLAVAEAEVKALHRVLDEMKRSGGQVDASMARIALLEADVARLRVLLEAFRDVAGGVSSPRESASWEVMYREAKAEVAKLGRGTVCGYKQAAALYAI